jgi:hypothetical protein
MFRSLLGRKLVSRTRAVRRVALIVSLFAVAALPYVNAGAQRQQKQVSGKKSGAANARINTRQSEKPAAKAVAVKGTDDAQAFAVCTQNQPITFGQTINGSLANGDCVSPVPKPGNTQPDGSLADEYTFNGTAGQQIAISMSSTAFDTYLYLLRPDGTVLAQNDDIDQESNPPNQNSRIPPNGFIILPFSGTFSILASSFAPEARGAYTLTLTAGANCSLTPIAYGETKQGSLTVGDCTNSIDQDGTLVDLYTFNGTAGQQVSISMTAGAGSVAPYLYLLQPNGDLIAESGSGGSGAHIPPIGEFGRLPMTGTYIIVANTISSSQSGNYSLTLTKAATDCPNVPLTLGTTANGSLSNGDCRLLEDGSFLDAYTFTAAANAQVVITMTSTTAGLTPVLFLLSPNGSVVAIGIPPTGSSTARIPEGAGSFILPATGTYTVLANSLAPGQVGNYTLTLNRSVQPNAHTISGRVTGGGVGLSGVTVTLSGGASATTTTDANGFYSFVEFPAGNSYTITPTDTPQYTFTPQTVPSLQTDQTVNFVGTPRASEIIISEFRTFGPTGTCDEFVEIYNTRSTQYVVQATDNSLGFAVAQSNGNVLFIIPNNTAIPARGHYLAVNNGGSGCTGSYSNSDYPAGNGTTATGDNTLNEDIPSNAGIALFNTSNQGSFNLANRLDAVGTSAEANPLYKEGTGYPVFQSINETANPRYSIFRNAQSGLPQDTNNNETDFQTADESSTEMCTSTANFNCRRLGAPGPENLSSPVQHNADIKASLVDPQCPGITVNPTLRSACRFERRSEQVGPAPSFGTFAIRRRFTNMTGSPVTRLRFRIVDVTNDFLAPSNIADIRAITSPQVTATCQNESGTPHLCSDTGLPTTTIEGTTREPDQPFSNGGGFNSTVSAGTVTLANPLTSGASLNLQFLFGVQQSGAFRFFVNVEALTAPPAALEATKAGASKRAGSRKGK